MQVVNEKRTELRQREHIRDHFCRGYSVAVNQEIMALQSVRRDDFNLTTRNTWVSSFSSETT